MIRKIKEYGPLPQIIFLTNFKDSDHVSRALDAAGATDYIVKSDVHMDAIIERGKNKIGTL